MVTDTLPLTRPSPTKDTEELKLANCRCKREERTVIRPTTATTNPNRAQPCDGTKDQRRMKPVTNMAESFRDPKWIPSGCNPRSTRLFPVRYFQIAHSLQTIKMNPNWHIAAAAPMTLRPKSRHPMQRNQQ